MRSDLDARGIQLVTLCPDSPEAIRKGRHKHGARAMMLSDADLDITTRYNLINQGGLTPKGIAPLPIPTSILVDAEGIVRWIDQAENYQQRSHPERVLAAIQDRLV